MVLLFLKIFIYLAVPGLAAHKMFNLCCNMWAQSPDQGLNLGPLHWDCGVLATGPPGKSPSVVLEKEYVKVKFFETLYMRNDNLVGIEF